MPYPKPDPGGGTRAPSRKSISAPCAKFFFVEISGTYCLHLFHPVPNRVMLANMDQQRPTDARLREVGRALRIADERARRLADETGLSIEAVEQLARAACASGPVGRPLSSWSERLSFAADGSGPILFHQKRSTIALRIIVERAADRSLTSDAAAYRKLITSHGDPTWSTRERSAHEQALKDAVKSYLSAAH